MIQFTKPKNLNGAELLAELNAGSVSISQTPLVDAENVLWLDIAAADEAKAKLLVAAHNGTIAVPEQTLDDKLAAVGVTLNDLKAALGL